MLAFHSDIQQFWVEHDWRTLASTGPVPVNNVRQQHNEKRFHVHTGLTWPNTHAEPTTLQANLRLTSTASSRHGDTTCNGESGAGF